VDVWQMSVLEFIFSSFWVFIGAVILIDAVFLGIANVVRACRGVKE
jgi:hypothetical protein